MRTGFEHVPTDGLHIFADNLLGLVLGATAEDATVEHVEAGRIFSGVRESVEAELLRRGEDVEPLI